MKKKRIVSLMLIAASAVMPFASFAKSKSATSDMQCSSKTCELPAFDKIKQEWIADVIITQGPRQTVTVEGSARGLEDISMSVNDGILTVGRKKGREIYRNYGDIKVYITLPRLSMLQSDGIGDIDVKGSFEQTSLTVVSNGTGDIDISDFSGNLLQAAISGAGDFEAAGSAASVVIASNGTGDCELRFDNLRELNVTVNGAGDVEARGSVKSALFTVNGTGDIKAAKMLAGEVTASSTGAGDIICFASESFACSNTGSGDITCHGFPKNRRD